MPPPRPLRFVLAAAGTRGDVQPLLAVAHAVQARGHSILIAASPEFADWVRSQGLAFTPVGQNIQQFLAANPDVLTGNPLKAMRSWRRFFAQEIPLQSRQLQAACVGADAVAWAGLALSAPSVGEHLGIPVTGIVYSTSLIPSSLHPPPTFPWQGLPRWCNRLLWKLQQWAGQKIAGPAMNAARAAMGLAPVELREYLFGQARYLIATDEKLFPADPAWGPHFGRANYIFFDDPQPLDAQLAAWIDQGEPPVFVGFGSMPVLDQDHVARVIVQAVTATGRRCLVGGTALAGQALPPGWRMVREAPHALLFPRMAVVVHHGGSGTTANALRAGVPQVILPLILDQYQHAHRLHLADLAPRPVPMERVTAAQLTAAIHAALALPPGPCAEVAKRLQASDGRGDIARHLEALASAAREAPEA